MHFVATLLAASALLLFGGTSHPVDAIAFFNLPPASSSVYVDGHGDCLISDELRDEIAAYAPTVQRIISSIVGPGAPLAGDTWRSLSEFIESFGPRLTGSAALERSIDWLLGDMSARGLQNVHGEPVSVPRWERGYESAELVAPYAQRLNILGLGSSVGTPRGGLIADVLAVATFDEFAALDASEVHGKIVLFAPQWNSYGETVAYRSRAASVAAAKGAVAALVRSVTPVSIGSPHTGMQSYEAGVPQIPVASVTVEDAMQMLALCRRGTRVSVRLEMAARTWPDAVQSRNTVAELVGAVRPANESVVVVAGHLDSWDVGHGAMDDAGGAFVAWKAVEFLQKLQLRPKRTIRAILWTGEEQGYLGAVQYQKDHSVDEAKEFNFFMESDMGTFEPTGLGLSGTPEAKCVFAEIVKLLQPLNATALRTPGNGMSDVELWTERGFPGAGLENRNEQYFWYHHSAGDSMLMESPENLDKCTALFAAVAYVVADLSEDIPRKLVV